MKLGLAPAHRREREPEHPDAMAGTKWYYQDPVTEERAGPVKVEFIRNLIETNVVQEDTLVWTKGMVEWVSEDGAARLLRSSRADSGRTTSC